MRSAGPVEVEDAAVVIRHLDARITLSQSQDLACGRAPHGELWLALVALLALAPPQVAAGDPAAALRRLEAMGVDESFAVRFSALLPPASSAVWLVVDGASLAGA